MDDLDFTMDTEDCVSSSVEENEWQWTVLIDQVIKGNVIPVIGSELTSSEGRSISDKLVKSLSKLCNMNTPARSFSQLIPRFKVERKNDDIYNFVGRALANEKYSSLTTPSVDLINLLSIKYFPFVIYTSYDQTVENAMKKIHGNKLRVLTFDNQADTNDDISAHDNLKTPTLYYFFGKANTTGRRYVLSDKDMLEFSRSWLAETDNSNKSKPANLSNALANKFLLVLGCNYTDWLFRFFWFAMKDSKIRHREDDCQKIGMLTLDGFSNDDLIDFLTRSNTLTQNISCSEFITQLNKRLSVAEIENNNNLKLMKFDKPQEYADVFISYSRADIDIAEKLYYALSNMGLEVWFDKKNLGAGAEFWKDIRFAIRTSRIFVPIFTDNIKKQYRDEHVYRDEWDAAIEHKRRVGNVTYICPLCSEDFDIEDRESDIPEMLKMHNICTYAIGNVEEGINAFSIEISKMVQKLNGDESK